MRVLVCLHRSWKTIVASGIGKHDTPHERLLKLHPFPFFQPISITCQVRLFYQTQQGNSWNSKLSARFAEQDQTKSSEVSTGGALLVGCLPEGWPSLTSALSGRKRRRHATLLQFVQHLATRQNGFVRHRAKILDKFWDV